MRIEVDREMCKWTVRVNGLFIADFWREVSARRLSDRLRVALQGLGQ